MNKSRYCPGKPSLSLIKETQHCDQCDTVQLCLNSWLDGELIPDVDKITLVRGNFEAGQAIFRMEDRFRSLFIVQSGTVKVEKALEDGTNHVNGFYFSGDLFALESIGDSYYNYDAIALEKSRICEIPYDHLESLSSSAPRLREMFISLLGKKVRQTNTMLLDGRYLTAEKRLMLFLKSLCKRNLVQIESNRGRLNLPMSKVDIASYLGLRPESVSRALTKLQKQGVILNHPKYIEINDIDAAMRMICKF